MVRIPLSMLRLVIDFVEQVSNRLCSPAQIRLPKEDATFTWMEGGDVDGELCGTPGLLCGCVPDLRLVRRFESAFGAAEIGLEMCFVFWIRKFVSLCNDPGMSFRRKGVRAVLLCFFSSP